MNEHIFPDAEVAVAVIMDKQRQIFWTWSDSWGAFTLPMTKIRGSEELTEPPKHAAARAAAEALGVPVEVGEAWGTLPMTRVSDRNWSVKHYTYHVFPAEAHAEFAAQPCFRRPHIWLPAHVAMSGLFRPLSHSARDILRLLMQRGLIPGRRQETCILVVKKECDGKPKFLLRWNRDWGYFLPAKRKNPTDDPVALARRILSDELGLGADSGVTLQPGRIPILLTFGISKTQGAPRLGTPTDYHNWIFEAQIPNPFPFKSAEPLVWATEEEILSGVISTDAATDTSTGAPSKKISPTVFQVLSELNEISWHPMA
jgi:8-oxo-dGTP pyrophosphatase MutT (NUDIX family)